MRSTRWQEAKKGGEKKKTKKNPPRHKKNNNTEAKMVTLRLLSSSPLSELASARFASL